MNENNKTLTPYLEMGGAFMLGLAIGITLQKSFKIVTAVLILGAIVIFLLDNQGIINLNQGHLQSTLDIGVKEIESSYSILKDKLNQYKSTSTWSVLLGIIVGIKMG